MGLAESLVDRVPWGAGVTECGEKVQVLVLGDPFVSCFLPAGHVKDDKIREHRGLMPDGKTQFVWTAQT